MHTNQDAVRRSENRDSAIVVAPRIRDAAEGDLAALVEIEQEEFKTDRLSRRSFRNFLRSTRAILRVAEIDGAVVGYQLVLLRRGSASARLYSIAVAAGFQHHGLGAALLADAETEAYAAGAATLRLEVGVQNDPARALYRRAGYREIARLPGYYDNGEDAVRLAKPLRGEAAHAAGAPYYEQTTEFTCGPACLMMALGARKPTFVADQSAEVRLWRRSTTVFMTSGLGGCEPFGLAVTLAEEGLSPEVFVTDPGLLLLQTVRNPEKRRVMELAQEEFQRRAKEMGIPVHHRRMDVAELAVRLSKGELALLLVSGNLMFGKRVPHWVLAHGADEQHVFIHDPWVDCAEGESATDAEDIPAPFAALDRMWRWGATRLRAAVVIPPPERTGK